MIKRLTPCLIFVLLVIPVLGIAENIEDLRFGFYVDRLLVCSQTIVFNEKLNRRINEIGTRMVRASENPLSRYTFRVINDPIINAYSAAGGYIYVDTGLLDILESEDELAAILGHEIAHTNNNHQINSLVSFQRMKVIDYVARTILSYSFAIGMSAGAAAAFSSARSPSAQEARKQLSGNVAPNVGAAIGQQLGIAMTISMIKGYGGSRELEADTLAVKNMHKAGYNPNAFIGVFKKLISIRERLGQQKDSYLSNLINAEPGLDERMKNVEELISRGGK